MIQSLTSSLNIDHVAHVRTLPETFNFDWICEKGSYCFAQT